MIISRSPAATAAAGERLARELAAGAVVALAGDLGAGKTELVKGLAVGLGCPAAVTSPTFTIIHEYRGGRLPLYHVDFYRLATAAEVCAVGFEECLEAGGVVAVEWADKFPGLIPADARWLNIRIGAGSEREIAG